MKTLKNTGITLMFAIVAATTAVAQSPNPVLAKAEAFAPIEISYPQAVAKVKTFGTSLYRIKDSMKMRLSMEKKAGERAIVRLLDENGQVLHENRVGKLTKRYACEFDFSQIKDGRYTIEVANGAEITRQVVDLSSAETAPTPARHMVAFN